MNKIYLINPSEKEILDNAGDRVPLGLLSIGTYLKHKKGLETRIWDLNHDSEDEMFNQMEYDKPEVVGISVYTSGHLKESQRLASKVPKGIKKIAGGHHANAMPYSLLNDFDSVVVGEGENKIIRAINETGIVIGDRVNLERLSNPDRSMLDMSRYGISQEGKRTATLITSRGCPYGCSFCGNYLKKVKFSLAERINEQTQEVDKEGFDSIYFVDDLFTVDKDRIKDIARHSPLPFRVTTRAKLLSEEKAYILGKHGCEWLSLGIESGNDEILKRVNKHETSLDNAIAVSLANKYNIKTKGFFIIGLPGETEKTARQTINFAKKLKDFGLKQASFYYLIPYPGTPIWKDPKSFGLKIKDRNFTNYFQAGPKAKCVVETEELNSSRIEELVKEANEEWKS